MSANPSPAMSFMRLLSLVCIIILHGCASPPSPEAEAAAEAEERGRVTRDTGTHFAPPAHRLNPARPPSRNFDLSRWKLTIPNGEDIQVEDLNKGYVLTGAFYTDPRSGGMVFRSPNRAGSTENSSYSRAELREMLLPTESAKDDANNWTMEQGGRLRATLRIDRVSTTGDEDKVGRVVIGQIHGDDSEVVRLYYRKRPDEEKGRIYAGLDSADNDNVNSPDIISNKDGDGIALGETFSYEIQLIGEELRVIVQPPRGAASMLTKRVDSGYSGENLYFKAGLYNQNDTGDPRDYAQATFFALEATHP